MRTASAVGIAPEEAWKGVETRRDAIERIISGLRKQRMTYADGAWDYNDQHCMRILKSRIRLLEREWRYVYGTSEQRSRAIIELNLNQDDGTLVQIGEKKHHKGRLDCPACDVDVDHALKSKAQFCRQCQNGICHVYTVVEASQRVVASVPGATIDVGGSKSTETRLVTVRHQCDTCDHKTSSVQVA